MQPAIVQSRNEESAVRVRAVEIPRDGTCRRHPRLSPLLYQGAFALQGEGALDPGPIERVFGENGWRNGWRDTVYDYDHFHSSAHEVLGCYRGHATLQLGGPNGPLCRLSQGDVLLLPAGTAHRKVSGGDDFAVVGCYAEGRDYDMQQGQGDETTEARMRALPLPARDPLFGAAGPLAAHLVQG
jgi:uncharacterized protein YjlB